MDSGPLLTAGDAIWTEYPNDKRRRVYPASILAVRGHGHGREFKLKFGRTFGEVAFYDPEWVNVAEMVTLVRWHDGPSTLALTPTAISCYLPTLMADSKLKPPKMVAEAKRVRNQTVPLDNSPGVTVLSPSRKKKKTDCSTPARAPARAKRPSAAASPTVPIRRDWEYDAGASVEAIDGVYQALDAAKQAFVPIKEALDAAKRVTGRTPPLHRPPPTLSDSLYPVAADQASVMKEMELQISRHSAAALIASQTVAPAEAEEGTPQRASAPRADHAHPTAFFQVLNRRSSSSGRN